MAFLPKHFFKQMDEYIIEKEKDKKKKPKTKLGVGTQRAVEASQKLVSWTLALERGTWETSLENFLEQVLAEKTLELFSLLFIQGNECHTFFENKDWIKDTWFY